MKLILSTAMVLYVLCVPKSSCAQEDMELRFTKPAAHFTQSLPLGNGRLGAMVFGQPHDERIVLNEISMWSGGIQNADRPDAHQYLQPIQQLLLEGKNLDAQKLLEKHFVCAGRGTGNGNGGHAKYGCYQTLGDCWIRSKDTTSIITDYVRTLRLDSAIATVSWKSNGVAFKEQVIVSAPQQAIYILLSTSRPGELHFTTGLSRKENASIKIMGGHLEMKGSLDGGDGDEGVRYAAVMSIVKTDGQLDYSDSALTVSNATECLLVITAATDMNWPHIETRGPDPLQKALQQAGSAAAHPWSTILQTHVLNFQRYFSRCHIHLDTPPSTPYTSLSDRLERIRLGGDDPAMVGLYFNFGRYLLISSSRGSLPSNLQGLWAEEYQTPWNGDYHTNINIQMNYWLTDEAGLPDFQKPMLDLLGLMSRYGYATAKAYYSTQGWVAHSITNPWGFTAPGEGAEWGSSVSGGAWLATHIWTHYQYYPDKDFLRTYYPILKGAALFFTGMLIREPVHHWLVTAPSNSPENSFRMPDGSIASTCMGPTMDMQIARQLLLATASSARLLGIDTAWADSLRSIVTQLAPDQVSPRTGAIQEWLQDYDEPDPQHRHISPLYGLYPYDEINPWATPLLADAAKRTLERRGDEGTGWSRAWKIACWARLGDGNHAYKMLKALWKPAGKDPASFTFSDAGTYPNLFDACPPFQIDGNFGATAAIMELFLQSQAPEDILRPLPALPDAAIFQNGHVEGLHARNGFAVDMSWRAGKLISLKVHSGYGGVCRIRCITRTAVRDDRGRIVTSKMDGQVLRFNTRKGQGYIIQPFYKKPDS